MRRSVNYNTKQSRAIIGYIASLGGAHVTAAQIVAHFEKEKVAIGRTTVYRHLDKLTESGKLRKFTTDGVSGACYQYADAKEICREHFHLKCEDCGELLHLECGALSEIQNHIFDEHAFKINALKTVLYGKCDNCLNNA